jgi:hypothetical protein
MRDGRLQRTEWGLLLFTLVVLATLVTATATSAASFSPYNDQWQGGSELQTIATGVGVKSDVTLNVGAYGRTPPPGTVAVVLSPDRPYTADEAAAVERFVRRGGTLLVAEDFGPHSNDLLASIGASSRLDGRLLVDEEAYYNSPTMPVARPDTSTSLLVEVDAFTLNHGTYVVPNGAQVLVESSEFATVVDDEGKVVSTALGPYPFVTAERVGAGTVLVVSDSSALINVMLDRPGNSAFVRNVFSRHDRVLLDYSHGGPVPPVGRAVETVQTSPTLLVVVGVFCVLVVGLLTTLVGRTSLLRRLLSRVRSSDYSRSGGPPHDGRGDHLVALGSRVPSVPWRRADRSQVDESTLVEQLHDSRPEWNDARIERVARAIRELSSEAAAEGPERSER